MLATGTSLCTSEIMELTGSERHTGPMTVCSILWCMFMERMVMTSTGTRSIHLQVNQLERKFRARIYYWVLTKLISDGETIIIMFVSSEWVWWEEKWCRWSISQLMLVINTSVVRLDPQHLPSSHGLIVFSRWVPAWQSCVRRDNVCVPCFLHPN